MRPKKSASRPETSFAPCRSRRDASEWSQPRRQGGHGNGHSDEAPEPQQSLFSWAEFMAEEPVKSKGRGRKPQPAAASLFEWALEMEQEREEEPVGAGR